MPNRAKQQPATRPEIFGYHDYRKFLRDWVAYLRQGHPELSLRALARKAQLSSAYLPLVLSGQRKLSAKALEHLGPLLDLKATERDFLNLLRIFSDSESDLARADALKRIQEFRNYRERNPKETAVYQYLEHWYYVAIREMAAIPGFRAEVDWIFPRLGGKVTPAEIRQAIQFLGEHGYLELLPDGGARQTERNLECIGGVHQLGLRTFHRQMLANSADVLEEVRSLEVRCVMGYTFAYPQSRFAEIKKVISEAIDRMEAIGKKAPAPDTVYHATFLAVPLTSHPNGVKEDDEKN